MCKIVKMLYDSGAKEAMLDHFYGRPYANKKRITSIAADSLEFLFRWRIKLYYKKRNKEHLSDHYFTGDYPNDEN